MSRQMRCGSDTRYQQGISDRMTLASNDPQAVLEAPLALGVDDHFQLRTSDRMSSMAPAPTSVYLYYDRFDILIYVGITGRGIARNVEHNTSKEWWQYVARQEVEHFATRLDALGREKALIQKHRPPFNKQHNPDAAQMRDSYLLFVAAHAEPAKLHEAVRALDGRSIWLDVHNFGDDEHLVFRSRIEDHLIAHALEMPPQGSQLPRAFGFKSKNKGSVLRLVKQGPFALFIMSKMREQPIRDAYAQVRFDSRQRLILRNVQVRQPGVDGPREREIRWVRPDGEGREAIAR